MCRMLLVFITLLLTFEFGFADDLFKVNLHSRADAEKLRSTGVEPIVQAAGGYVVLADDAGAEKLRQSDLDFKLLASGVSKDQLAFDNRLDDKNARKHRVLFEAEQVRLLLIKPDPTSPSGTPPETFPIRNERLTIEYSPTVDLDLPDLQVDGLRDILVDQVNYDSLYSYTWELQTFPYRTSGSPANAGARLWVRDKFLEFGYTDVELHYFPAYFNDGYNVIARKPGTLYPEQHIVVGAHFDAVLSSPGADDNASGVACVLEIARILKDVDLPVTLVFVAFDAEEDGLLGSHHYVDDAIFSNEDIIYMHNMDMIGAEQNDAFAALHYGSEIAYAVIWRELGFVYGGITGVYSGTSTRSDHFPFQLAGIDICSNREFEWSWVYHTPADSTTYMNFDYMTRMVKVNLATVYTVAVSPRAIAPAGLRQGGDGHSMQLVWHPTEWPDLYYYRVSCWEMESPYNWYSIWVPATDTTCLVTGLVEGMEHGFCVQAVATDGKESPLHYRNIYGIPTSIPVPPEGLLAMPVKDAVQLTWQRNNTELDLDHYAIFRDDELAAETSDTMYFDDDPGLGEDLHSYFVEAVDIDGIHSGAIDTLEMRAATLDPNRILAVNRTGNYTVDFASAYETGVFLQAALQPYDYDLYCDTLATKYPFDEPQFDLIDMVSHGVMVLGAEAGKYDDIGVSPLYKNGILDTLAYYMSIGGKLIVFGRWGDLGVRDTINYTANTYDYDDAYANWFHINTRITTECEWPFLSTTVYGDMVGAHGRHQYPQLPWDSVRTVQHANSQNGAVTDVTGIPCASFVNLTSDAPEVIYTYDCRKKTKSMKTEGQPVAWKYFSEAYSYVYFEIPLSMFERGPAIQALRMAVDELMAYSGPEEPLVKPMVTPNTFALHQNYPNPFNPTTSIMYDLPNPARVQLQVYNLLGQKVRCLVDRQEAAGQKTVMWDGTNEAGSPVASGLYFYRLRAGDFLETKKMLLLK